MVARESSGRSHQHTVPPVPTRDRVCRLRAASASSAIIADDEFCVVNRRMDASSVRFQRSFAGTRLQSDVVRQAVKASLSFF